MKKKAVVLTQDQINIIINALNRASLTEEVKEQQKIIENTIDTIVNQTKW